MNHKLNAKLHKLPPCPECGAASLEPCVTFSCGSQPREPHAIRQKIVEEEVFVISKMDAKRRGMLRAIRELAEVSRAAAKQKP